jgi:ABC-type transport system involved in cytochrome c biogenesis permease subunit
MTQTMMTPVAWVAAGSWATAAGVYAARPRSRRVADALMMLGIAAGAALLAMLWISLDRPPMRTLGETRWWYAVLVPALGMLIGWRFQTRAIAIPAGLMGCAFAVINLRHPEYMDRTLMPALQSPWFVPHVVVYMLAYSALGLSSLLALWNIVRRVRAHEAVHVSDVDVPHRMVMVGFPLLSMGLIFGALWAKEAWGHYWSWDPKETWAFLTWAVYLVYLHVRAKHAVQPRLNLGLLAAGFAVLLMCWFGVNKLPSAQESVHTYTQS